MERGDFVINRPFAPRQDDLPLLQQLFLQPALLPFPGLGREGQICQFRLDAPQLDVQSQALFTELIQIGAGKGGIEGDENLVFLDNVADTGIDGPNNGGAQGLDNDGRRGRDQPALGHHDSVHFEHHRSHHGDDQGKHDQIHASQRILPGTGFIFDLDGIWLVFQYFLRIF